MKDGSRLSILSTRSLADLKKQITCLFRKPFMVGHRRDKSVHPSLPCLSVGIQFYLSTLSVAPNGLIKLLISFIILIYAIIITLVSMKQEASFTSS
jgi:hypothetical protein